MTPSQTTIGALALALPILGFGVAPVILAPPSVEPSTPFCDRPEGAAGELNGDPAVVWRLCDSPFLLVVPATPVRAPEAATDMEEPQFFSPQQLRIPPVDDTPF